MTSQYDTGFPSSPLTDPQTGEVMPAWRRFFQTLWGRTGQTRAPAVGVALGPLAAQVDTLTTEQATLSAQVAALIALGTQPSVTVTPSPSPYAYTAPSAGTLYVSGGGVEAMTLKRGTGAARAVGAFYGGKRLMSGDVLTITYSAAPTLAFFPG